MHGSAAVVLCFTGECCRSPPGVRTGWRAALRPSAHCESRQACSRGLGLKSPSYCTVPHYCIVRAKPRTRKKTNHTRTFAGDGVAGVLAEAHVHPRASCVVQNHLQVVLVSDPHVLEAAVRAVEHPRYLLLLGNISACGGGIEIGIEVGKRDQILT